MKTEQGLVIEVIGDVAKIKVGRHSDCKNCGACPGNDSVIICAKNKAGAKCGQRVEFEVKEANVLWAAFIVFILPLIALFVGAMIGGFIGKSFGVSITIFQIIGGLVAAVASLIFVKICDKNTAKNNKSMPVIVKIL